MKYVWKQNPHEPGVQEAIETMKKKKYQKKNIKLQKSEVRCGAGGGSKQFHQIEIQEHMRENCPYRLHNKHVWALTYKTGG